MEDLWAALALVFVIEGLLPFAAPHIWRKTMLQMAEQSDMALRVMGAISMVLGLIVLNVIR